MGIFRKYKRINLNKMTSIEKLEVTVVSAALKEDFSGILTDTA